LEVSRRDELVPRAVDALAALPGVDLTIWRDDGWAAVRGEAGTLRFRPGNDLTDAGGRGWELDGDESALALEVGAGSVGGETYPDALGRLWSALRCPHSGDVLVSASPGAEYTDWGGAHHVGGGSHGALHRDDSEGVLLLCGVDAPARDHWSLTDVTPLVLEHFGVPSAG
jgi:hypothetical protein